MSYCNLGEDDKSLIFIRLDHNACIFSSSPTSDP
eukprot:UN05328